MESCRLSVTAVEGTGSQRNPVHIAALCTTYLDFLLSFCIQQQYTYLDPMVHWCRDTFFDDP